VRGRHLSKGAHGARGEERQSSANDVRSTAESIATGAFFASAFTIDRAVVVACAAVRTMPAVAADAILAVVFAGFAITIAVAFVACPVVPISAAVEIIAGASSAGIPWFATPEILVVRVADVR